MSIDYTSGNVGAAKLCTIHELFSQLPTCNWVGRSGVPGSRV